MSLWYVPEILSHVRAYANLSDFTALCRVSKAIYGVGQRLLYESIHLILDHQHPKSLFLLCSILEKNSSLALHVKFIRLQFGDSSDFSKDRASKLHETNMILSSRYFPGQDSRFVYRS